MWFGFTDVAIRGSGFDSYHADYVSIRAGICDVRNGVQGSVGTAAILSRSCPLWVTSGHLRLVRAKSALPPKSRGDPPDWFCLCVVDWRGQIGDTPGTLRARCPQVDTPNGYPGEGTMRKVLDLRV
jgi:hypothetical protein